MRKENKNLDKKPLEQNETEQDLQETQSVTEQDTQYEREQFVRSPFLFIGLLICAIASGCILAKGQTGKELLFHTAYIVGFLLYAICFFVSKKCIPATLDLKTRAKSFAYDIGDCIFTVVIALVLATFLLDCFKISVVEGKSMTNTLKDGQKLILSTHIYDFEDIERYDIVVCYSEGYEEYIIKRVIGLPGDHLVIKDNQLYINDELLQEDYIKEPMVTDDLDVTIPEGKLFVMGDNRNGSDDSRIPIIGLMDIEKHLKGKIIFQHDY